MGSRRERREDQPAAVVGGVEGRLALPRLDLGGRGRHPLTDTVMYIAAPEFVYIGEVM